MHSASPHDGALRTLRANAEPIHSFGWCHVTEWSVGLANISLVAKVSVHRRVRRSKPQRPNTAFPPHGARLALTQKE